MPALSIRNMNASIRQREWLEEDYRNTQKNRRFYHDLFHNAMWDLKEADPNWSEWYDSDAIPVWLNWDESIIPVVQKIVDRTNSILEKGKASE